MTIIKKDSLGWGIPNLDSILAATVYDSVGNVLISRSTSFIKSLFTGSTQYVVSIPNWDVSWGAYIYYDDGEGRELLVWFDSIENEQDVVVNTNEISISVNPEESSSTIPIETLGVSNQAIIEIEPIESNSTIIEINPVSSPLVLEVS